MTRSLLAAIFGLTALALPVHAQEVAATATPSLALELNALQPADTGCRVTFLATNELGGVLDRAAVELALFDAGGTIVRIVTLDFKNLSQGKTKVLQFELADLACDGIGRLLVNDITACEGTGLAPTACLDGLVTTAKPSVVFGA